MTTASTPAKDRLRALARQKADLLTLLATKKAGQLQPIPSYPRHEGALLPVSLTEERHWLIDYSEGGSVGFQVPLALRIVGPLDLQLVQRALDTVVQRHEALRTVFVPVDGYPMKQIAATATFDLKTVDLRELAEPERDAEVRRNKDEEVLQKFDLRAGPLIRGRLLRLQAEENMLLITLHHIIIDGWSKGILLREFAQAYTAYSSGQPLQLEPLPLQYVDYSQWQREQWATGRTLEKRLAYWRSRLTGATPHLELPADRPRPAKQNFRGENVLIFIDARLTARLKSFAQKHEMTPFMILFTGLAILFSHLSGQEDLTLGSPIANRQRPEFEGLFGLFVNPIALRVQVQKQMRLRELLEQVKTITLGGYDNQDIPFEKVAQALQPERHRVRGPLYQAVFVFHNEPRTEVRLPDLAVTLEKEIDEPALLDIWLSLEERGDVIAGNVNYAAELFDRATMERWMDGFKTVLSRMVEDPLANVAALVP